MNMSIEVLLTMIALECLSAPLICAQQPMARAEFEVAAIKLNSSCGYGPGRGGAPQSPGTLSLDCHTVQNLIQMAYDSWANGVSLNPRIIQIFGGPGWIDSEYYDIHAKAEGGAPVPKMAGPMLQTLLETRFKLKVHRETREGPVYVLTVAKSGPKLQQTKEGSCIPLDFNHPPPPPAPGQPFPNLCGPQRMGRNGSALTMGAVGMTVADFANGLLGKYVDHPILDKTGLTGLFDFHLEFSPAPMAGPQANGLGDTSNGAMASDFAGLSIFAALEQRELSARLHEIRRA